MRYKAIPPLREAIQWALRDSVVRKTLRGTLERYYEEWHLDRGIPDELRIAIKAIQSQSIQNIEKHLKTLQAHNHIVLHQPQTEEDLRSLLRRILTQNPNSTHIVTTWAPIIDELHIRELARELGYTLTFVDIAGHVLQYTQEPPAHPTFPLAHLTLRNIAAALESSWQQYMRENAQEIVQNVVSRTRRAIASADIGIINAQFVIAETGEAVLLDDEGARILAATMPPQVVVVAGLEALVPTWEDVNVLAHGYWLGARGKRMAPYVGVIAGDEYASQKIHLVLVDNGRRRLVGTPYEEVLYCLHCGACAIACPVFREVGGQVYASPYMGPIGSVWSPLLWPEEHEELSDMCSLCGACSLVCPAGIDVPGLIARFRYQRVIW